MFSTFEHKRKHWLSFTSPTDVFLENWTEVCILLSDQHAWLDFPSDCLSANTMQSLQKVGVLIHGQVKWIWQHTCSPASCDFIKCFSLYSDHKPTLGKNISATIKRKAICKTRFCRLFILKHQLWHCMQATVQSVCGKTQEVQWHGSTGDAVSPSETAGKL